MRHTPTNNQKRVCRYLSHTCSNSFQFDRCLVATRIQADATPSRLTSSVYGGLSPHAGGIYTLPYTAPTISVTCIRVILAVPPHLRCPGFRSVSPQPELTSAFRSRRLIPIRSSIATAVTAIGKSLITSVRPTALIDVPHTQPTRTQISRTRRLGSLKDEKVTCHIFEAEQPFSSCSLLRVPPHICAFITTTTHISAVCQCG
jgi:hypothetical protein